MHISCQTWVLENRKQRALSDLQIVGFLTLKKVLNPVPGEREGEIVSRHSIWAPPDGEFRLDLGCRFPLSIRNNFTYLQYRFIQDIEDYHLEEWVTISN